MAWWQWLVGILLFIVALGVLIGIHELGHLAAAKAFKVYCFNYSIGFGPALISSKRSKKHETIWTLRAIPLGGFVSMYGEGAELDTDEYIPPSRSLEGVARYKRGIIVSAGVILNFILGFILIFAHNAFFDHVSFTFYNMYKTGDTYATSFIISADDSLTDYKDNALKLTYDPLSQVSIANNQTTSVYVLNNEITINDVKYVLCFKNAIYTTKTDPDISSSLGLYKKADPSEKISKAVTDGFTNQKLLTMYIANEKIDPKDTDAVNKASEKISSLQGEDRNTFFVTEAREYYKEGLDNTTIDSSSEYKVASNTPEINTTLNVFKKNTEGKFEDLSVKVNFTLKPNSTYSGWDNTGIKIKRNVERYDFVKSLSVSGQEWCNANIAVFKGLGMLFTGQGQLSGPLGIAKLSSQVFANFGFERYLYLWGMISCNLAILNLLPFPGLDGFTLAVTAYEGIRKKQVPTKVKGIMSAIGLALLFTLMIVILVMDIIGMVA